MHYDEPINYHLGLLSTLIIKDGTVYCFHKKKLKSTESTSQLSERLRQFPSHLISEAPVHQKTCSALNPEYIFPCSHGAVFIQDSKGAKQMSVGKITGNYKQFFLSYLVLYRLPFVHCC
jgi:hypothetical protein